MKTLDRTKPFGVVQDEGNKAAFEQGGCIFDIDGHEINAAVYVEHKRPGRKKAVSVDDQIAAQGDA